MDHVEKAFGDCLLVEWLILHPSPDFYIPHSGMVTHAFQHIAIL